jgi:hypothetical protein
MMRPLAGEGNHRYTPEFDYISSWHRSVDETREFSNLGERELT